jgi:hypothetical protein
MRDIPFDVVIDPEGEPVLKGNDGNSNVIVEFDRAVFGESASPAQRQSAAVERREQLGATANRKLAEGKFDTKPRAGGQYRRVVLTAKDVARS